VFDLFSPISDFFGTIAQWVGYGIIATFIVGSLFLLVAFPIAMKMAAVAFARVLIVETSNLVAKSGIASQVSNAVKSVEVAANKITNQIENDKLKSQMKIIEIENLEVK
jgi:hypothetical protein